MYYSPKVKTSFEIFSVRELCYMLPEFSVPDFGQKFRWGTEDIARLFYGIKHGYPIGQITVWETEEVIPSLPASPVSFTRTSDLKKKLYLLDGWHRFAAITGVLLAKEKVDPYFHSCDWHFSLDLLDDHIRSECQTPDWMKKLRRRLPLNSVLDTIDFLNVAEKFNHKPLREKAEKVANIICDHRVVLCKVRDASLEDARAICNQMNIRR
jgi:hypothetical protein